MRITGILFIFFGVITPVVAFGQNGLVPCNGPECNACHLVALSQNVLEFLIAVSVILAAIVFAWAGLRMVTAGGNEAQISAAKGMFSNVVIGLILVLAAWLIIDTIMKLFVEDGRTELGPWNQIHCITQTGTGAGTAQRPGTGTGGVTPVPGQGGTTGGTCVDCVAIPPNIPTNGNACGGSGPCQIDGQIAQNIINMGSEFDGWQVSEGWPATGSTPSDPTGVHSASCHGDGTCIDVSFVERNVSPSASEIISFSDSAAANGLTAVFEVSNPSRKAFLESQGVENVIVVSGINREHFSVYDCSRADANACG